MSNTIDYSTLFDYYDGLDQLPTGAFKISPSGVEKFFSDKTTWYRENLMGEARKFTGSSATVLGTCVHAAAEVVANAVMANTPHDSALLAAEIENYISTYDDDEQYDTTHIRNNWHGMAEPLIRDYVIGANTVATENYISHEIIPGVWVGGTYDAITSTAPGDSLDNAVGQLTVRDYKTASKKPSGFSYTYKLQAFTYAYILHQQGIKVANVELCYTVAPTKTLPVRTFNFTLPFDDQAYEFIEGILKLIAESVRVWNDYGDMRYLLAADYRLKQNDIPRP